MQRNHQEIKKNSGRVRPHPKREREIKNTKKNIALSSARENAGIILSWCPLFSILSLRQKPFCLSLTPGCRSSHSPWQKATIVSALTPASSSNRPDLDAIFIYCKSLIVSLHYRGCSGDTFQKPSKTLIACSQVYDLNCKQAEMPFTETACFQSFLLGLPPTMHFFAYFFKALLSTSALKIKLYWVYPFLLMKLSFIPKPWWALIWLQSSPP